MVNSIRETEHVVSSQSCSPRTKDPKKGGGGGSGSGGARAQAITRINATYLYHHRHPVRTRVSPPPPSLPMRCLLCARLLFFFLHEVAVNGVCVYKLTFLFFLKRHFFFINHSLMSRYCCGAKNPRDKG